MENIIGHALFALTVLFIFTGVTLILRWTDKLLDHWYTYPEENKKLKQQIKEKDEEIARVKFSYMAECSEKLHQEFIGHLKHMGVQPHCAWDGHPTAQILNTEYNVIYCRLLHTLKLLEEVHRRYQHADVCKTDNNYDSRYMDLEDLEDEILRTIKESGDLHAR